MFGGGCGSAAGGGDDDDHGGDGGSGDGGVVIVVAVDLAETHRRVRSAVTTQDEAFPKTTKHEKMKKEEQIKTYQIF